jgi:hypothetical protein
MAKAGRPRTDTTGKYSRQMAHYYRHRDRLLAEKRATKRERCVSNMAQIVIHLVANPCVDCGEDDIVVLQFDHVRGKKRDGVFALANRCCWEVVAKEIAKCDVRCANCHIRRHAKEQNSARYRAGKAVRKKR